MKHGLGRNIKTTKNLDYVVISGKAAQDMCTGWSSFTTCNLVYKILGGFLFFQFHVAGTSNSTNATINLNLKLNSQNLISSSENVIGVTVPLRLTASVVNNGGSPAIGAMRVAAAGIVNFSILNGTSTFTASGTKYVIGQAMIPIG